MPTIEIECSGCHKIYQIDDSKIPKRIVRSKCKKCGTIISIDNTPQKTQQIKPTPDRIIECPKCNAPVGIGDKECSACGIIMDKYSNHKLGKDKNKRQDQFKEPPKEKAKTRPIFVFSLIGLVSLILSAGFISYISSLTSGSSQDSVSITPNIPTSNKNQISSPEIKIDKSVFGIQMGETFITHIPECPELEFGKFPTGPCYEPKSSTDIVNGFIEVKLYNRPSFVKRIFAQLYSGNVERLTIYINGREFEEEALHSLIEKWGEPTISEVVSLTNGFGANFTSFEAHWVMDDMSCFFSPATDSKRVIVILTSYGSKMLSEKVDKLRQEEAKL